MGIVNGREDLKAFDDTDAERRKETFAMAEMHPSASQNELSDRESEVGFGIRGCQLVGVGSELIFMETKGVKCHLEMGQLSCRNGVEEVL